jgi:hypothetical protein
VRPRIPFARVPFAIVGPLIPLATLAACGFAQGRSATAGQHAGRPVAVAGRVASTPTGTPGGTAQPCGAEAAETLARTAGQPCPAAACARRIPVAEAFAPARIVRAFIRHG